MRTFTHITALLLASALFGTGCVSKSQYVKETQRADQMKVEAANYKTQSQNLQTNLDAEKAANAELQKSLDATKGEQNKRLAELSKQNQELAAMIRITQQNKDAEIAELKRSHDELVKGLETELQAGQVTITQLKGRLSVNMVDKILFNSGEAEIKKEGLKVIESVGEVLKKMEDHDIRIEGYTDNVPISGALRSKYPTNWELSTARSTAVVRYLEEKAGIPKERLIAVGFGETHPIAANDTPEGRQQNRRIEIVLVPRDTPASTPAVSTTTAKTAP